MLEHKAACDWGTPRLEMQSTNKYIPHLEGGKDFRMLKPDLRQTSIGKRLPRAPTEQVEFLMENLRRFTCCGELQVM